MQSCSRHNQTTTANLQASQKKTSSALLKCWFLLCCFHTTLTNVWKKLLHTCVSLLAPTARVIIWSGARHLKRSPQNRKVGVWVWAALRQPVKVKPRANVDQFGQHITFDQTFNLIKCQQIVSRNKSQSQSHVSVKTNIYRANLLQQ